MAIIILTLIIGGITSWAIAHEYSRLQNSNQATASRNVNRNINDVWEFISNPENFEKFRHNSSEPFNHTLVKKGSSFFTVSNHGNRYKEFVVDWEPPFRFSWGSSPENWNNCFYLTDKGDDTEITLTRTFRVFSWSEILTDIIFRSEHSGSKVNQELTEDMIDKLVRNFEND